MESSIRNCKNLLQLLYAVPKALPIIQQKFTNPLLHPIHSITTLHVPLTHLRYFFEMHNRHAWRVLIFLIWPHNEDIPIIFWCPWLSFSFNVKPDMRSKDVSKWPRTCSVLSNNVVANVDSNGEKKHFCVEQVCVFFFSFFFLLHSGSYCHSCGLYTVSIGTAVTGISELRPFSHVYCSGNSDGK